MLTKVSLTYINHDTSATKPLQCKQNIKETNYLARPEFIEALWLVVNLE